MMQDQPMKMKPQHNLSLCEEMYPDISDLKVGETKKILLTAKVTGIESGENMPMMEGEDKRPMSARFEVLDAEPYDEEEPETEEPEDNEEDTTEPAANPKVVNAVRNKFRKGY